LTANGSRYLADYATGGFYLIFLPLRPLRLCVNCLFSTQNRKEEKEQIQITISNA